MTIKFKRSGTPTTDLTILDNDKLSLAANADVAYGVVLVFDGEMSGFGGNYCEVFQTAGYQAADNIRAIWRPLDATANQGGFYFEVDASTTQRCVIGPVEGGQAYILIFQRSAGAWTSKLCPIQQFAPTNTTSVLSSASFVDSDALNATENMTVGGVGNALRRFGHSMSRFFRIERPLTDAEIMQLAYGKEITQFATPTFYFRMNDESDIVDTGIAPQLVATATGFVAGTEPNFGYSSTPTAPVINNKPVIVGSPVVGTAISYTPGPAIGNPSPTVTQQWTVDGVDKAGATGETYTPDAADNNKLLRVREIATNGVLPNASLVSDPVLIGTVAITMTPRPFVAEAIFQQINGIAPVPVLVTTTGPAPTKLEYQLYEPDATTIVHAWKDTLLNYVGGKFEGNVLMPIPSNGKKYKIAYQIKDAAGVVMNTSPVLPERFGVGDIYIGIGSSSMAGWFGSGSGSSMVVDHNAVSTNGDGASPSWALFDQYGQAGQMAMYWTQELGYPVAFINKGLGGSTLLDWSDINSDLFKGFISSVNYVGGKIAAVVSTCGSNDISTSSLTPSPARTVETHLNYLRTLAANIRQVTGQPNLTIFKSGISRRGTDTSQTAWTTDERANNARKAEQLFGDDPNNVHIQTLEFEMGGDGVHLAAGGYIACTKTVRYVMLQKIKHGQYLRGPKIQSLRFNGDKVNVELVHRSGNDFVPLTGIGGFIVTDEKTPGTFTPVTYTATRTNSNNILLSCDQQLVKPKVTYLAGANPVYPNQGFDNTPTIPLPISYEVFMDTVAGAIEVPKVLVPYFRTYQYDRAILAGAAGPVEPPPPVTVGSFTTMQMYASGTLQTNKAFKWQWHSGGVTGQTLGNVSMGSGVSDGQGRGIITGLPTGNGYIIVKTTDGVFYQEGTVT